MDIFTIVVMVVIALIFIVGIVDMFAFDIAKKREEKIIKSKLAELQKQKDDGQPIK